MSNNSIVAGFDDQIPQLDSSWPLREQIQWFPLKVVLERYQERSDVLIARVSGEIEAFNASYLAAKLKAAIETGRNCICLDLERTTLGDYREVLISGLLKPLKNCDGVLILKTPPKPLVEYWNFLFGEGFLKMEILQVVGDETGAIRHIASYVNSRPARLEESHLNIQKGE